MVQTTGLFIFGIDLILKNNTILPGESYTGYLEFKSFDWSDGGFDFYLRVGTEEFNFRGKYFDEYKYDEHDLPEDIEALTFE